MNRHIRGEAPVLATIRTVLIWTLIVGAAGTMTELLLITALYGKIFVHVNLNTATFEEILPIPGWATGCCGNSRISALFGTVGLPP